MLAEQRQAIAELLRQALGTLRAAPGPVELQRPKLPEHGDLSSPVALALARELGRPPRQVAEQIADGVRQLSQFADLLEAVEVAGPGFINLRLNAAAKQAVARAVLAQRGRFGHGSEGRGRRAVVEFVSANPTGPLHVGHARQAALGDALANLLAARGWQVSREFYYNDAGVQIDRLATSVQARARELRGEAIDPERVGYLGEYIVEIARAYLAGATVPARDGAVVKASGDPDDLEAIRRFAVAYLRNEQDLDLEALGIRFDHFYLESSLYADGRVEAAVRAMAEAGLTYESEGALWLRTTAVEGSGDDKDRVMRKADGTYTYFVPDVAYHVTKLQRGFERAINVQGYDHQSAVVRVRAGLQVVGGAMGLTVPPGYPEYLLHKMVRVMRGGQEVKMSKRAGDFVALRELTDWVGRDATRFFLVSRKGETEFAFDVDLAQSHSEDNPVYYVQYAHARICSVLAQATERGAALDEDAALRVGLAPLVSAREMALLARISDFPDVVMEAADALAPHQVAFYLKELAAQLHGFYNAERILVEDPGLRAARLALLLAVRQVLRNGLDLIGVSAPERM
ncbi:MAG TPA: arginine--tRNA ligase [Burkholderiaceae bacterium]|jgi:arginyl-tRNA synthetase|nr:arginine--tRNA ligase [Burkholderiaceae bacterium]